MTVPTFPTLLGVSYPIDRSPIWSTDKETAFSGQDGAFPNWSYPRYQYKVPFNYLGNDLAANYDWRTLLGFYNKVKASAGNMFQFNDREDGSITAQQIGTGDGATTAFQLVRTLGGFVEPVFAPLTVTAKVNGSTVSSSFSAAGIVTYASPPSGGAALTWDGTYNWYCRFDDDTIKFSNFLAKFWDLKELSFTTVKLLGDAT